MNFILKEDLDQIIKSNQLFYPLEGKTIFITGGTGLIGSLIAKSILNYNRKAIKKINLILLCRNSKKVESIFEDYISKTPELNICLQDINDKLQLDGPVDYIIHTASITSSAQFVKEPVETILTMVQGCKNILKFAYEKRVCSFVYLSSLEVYGIPFEENQISLFSENNFGYLDPCKVRSSYPEAKRLAESLCISYFSQYNIPVKIVRLCQTFGPGVSYNDSRVFAEFARCAIEGKNIELHTKGETVRNYCYTMDAVSGILKILLEGMDGQPYNLANKNAVVSIKEMAEIAKELSEFPIEIKYIIDGCDRGYNPEMKLVLTTEKAEDLGWKAETGMKAMMKRLIASMKA